MKRLARLTFVVLALTLLAPALPPTAEAQGPPKVTIIHKGRPITVSVLALPWHLLHGDTLPGTCTPPNCGGV